MSARPRDFRRAIAVLTLVLPVAARVASAAGPDPQAIQDVREGKRVVAQASWWGFQPEDSTAAVQAAIDSGARKVVVEKMPSPWIVDPLRLASDQELFFEPGAEVLAKKGSFHGSAESCEASPCCSGFARMACWPQPRAETALLAATSHMFGKSLLIPRSENPDGTCLHMRNPRAAVRLLQRRAWRRVSH